MAVTLASVQQGAPQLPPRILLYGVEGIGKTTVGAKAPNPIFIPTEDGLGSLDVPHFPLATSYVDVHEALMALAQEEHDRKTLVIDSADWLEPLIWKKLIIDEPTNEKGKPVASIEDYGFGKGYIAALDYWVDMINALNYLRAQKSMTVIIIAHSEVKKFEDPTSDSYDRYQVKIHKAAGAKLREWADAILFANYETGTVKSDEGFNKTRTRAVGQGVRLLFTEERPGFHAKNRYGMPPKVALSWDAVAATIPYFSTAS